jgi:hypothetical protein
VSEEQGNIAQRILAPLRRMDTKLDDVLARLSMLERRGALKDEVAVLDRIAVVELRRRVERIERRLDLADPNPPPAA